MKFKRAVLTCAILSGTAAMIAGGCGVITAPISVPKAIGENSNFSISGPIVDVAGKSLDHVIVSQELNHRLWEPAFGSTTNNYETRVRTFNGNYEATERGNELELKFTRDDFKETKIKLKNDSKLIETPLGNWPETKKFPVVMFAKDEPQISLRTIATDASYADYPVQKVICVNAQLFVEYSQNVETEAPPAGSVYVTLKKEPPKPINAKGDIDPLDLNLPGELVLHVAKTSPGEFGFVPFAPRLGFAPLQTMDQAPETGYKPELTISRARLKEMRTADKRNLVAAYEYFYFVSNDYYGKGCIRWTKPMTKNSDAEFHIILYAQLKTKDRDLTSHDAAPPFTK